ncbi:uncharacterized protein LOC122267952 [Penaeus japonicus]|uniref:uncharacterized protein LOC122267952 n=1 Tax=Penaeus japonicus TaxID=27405 RepID=UPI001C70C8AA|nr:uncharacterized protein LOC122267952 [Penaeus japonicus]
MSSTLKVTKMACNTQSQRHFNQLTCRVVENQYGTFEGWKKTNSTRKVIEGRRPNSRKINMFFSVTSGVTSPNAQVDKKHQTQGRSHSTKDKDHGLRKVSKSACLADNRKGFSDSRFNITKIFLKCYTCDEECVDDKFTEHLLFGEAVCSICSLRVLSCKQYQEEKMSSTCYHKFKFCRPFRHLFSKISCSISSKNYDKLGSTRATLRVSSYLSKLKSLKLKDPWMSAIIKCKKKLGDFRFQEMHHANANKNDYTVYPYNQRKLQTCRAVPSSKKQKDRFPIPKIYKITKGSPKDSFIKIEKPDTLSSTPNLPQVTQVRETPALIPGASLEPERLDLVVTGFLDTPTDGYYYVSRSAIEECPMCYEELCPSRFSVNVQTFLLTTVCIGCGLTIYIVIDPPDGVAPMVAIVTEK